MTPSGDRHAKDLALKLKDKLIAHAYTSHLSRAKQTLHHILKYHPETEVHVDDRIIERDYGRLSRKSKAKYEIQYPDLYPIYHRSYDVPPPGGESIKQVEKRVIPFLKEVIRTMGRENSNALIVAHGNSIRPIIRYFEQLSPEEMMKLENLRHKIYEYMI